ncbi:MAG: hypothetical protein ACP5NW_00255 [Candidatus Woesearchaeota archaeon]
MEISNKTLAWMVVAAIVVSFAGTLFSLNNLNRLGSMNNMAGFATVNASGNAQVQISSQAGLTFSVGALTFGSGSVNGTAPYHCNLTINKSTGDVITKAGVCSEFSDTNSGGPLTLENTGNVPLNVTINFSSDANNFIGGYADVNNPDPLFRFTVSDNETGSCGNLNNSFIGWTDVQNTSLATYSICDNMGYVAGTDSLSIGIKVQIPANAAQGVKTVYITATGTG